MMHPSLPPSFHSCHPQYPNIVPLNSIMGQPVPAAPAAPSVVDGGGGGDAAAAAAGANPAMMAADGT